MKPVMQHASVAVMQHDDLMWLAGLLEGEGWFGTTGAQNTKNRYAAVNVSMTDHDVVQRVAAILQCPCNGPYSPASRPQNKPYWSAKVTGKRAVEIMQIVLPYMGMRRSTKIKEVLEQCVR